MKVLWFTNTPSRFESIISHNYHGGGWIESLEELIKIQEGVELGISFFYIQKTEPVNQNGVKYYPIYRKKDKQNPLKSVLRNFKAQLNDNHYQNDFLKVINDFKPDIIQIFGTESSFGMIQEYTNIPVVIHLQGLLNPILNSFYPNSISGFDFLLSFKYLLKNLVGSSPYFQYGKLNEQAKREKDIFSKTKFVMGRTHWDKQISELFNPNITYFHVDEVLRDCFYESDILLNKESSKTGVYTIVSTISSTVYKGLDVILRAAKLLKEIGGFSFEWKLIGVNSNSDLINFFEIKEGVILKDVNIRCLGVLNAKELVAELLVSDFFVHTSYIDNSPNSICEAQMLGIPVIATNVGGISSLIQHLDTGILIPPNGIYELVFYLKKLIENDELRRTLSYDGLHQALFRHNKENIAADIMKIYVEIIDQCKRA